MRTGKVRIGQIRWMHTPPIYGCRWCGHGQSVHAQRWAASVGWHDWTEPTHAQKCARSDAQLPKTRTPM